jgi:hypothetical protein
LSHTAAAYKKPKSALHKNTGTIGFGNCTSASLSPPLCAWYQQITPSGFSSLPSRSLKYGATAPNFLADFDYRAAARINIIY